MSGQTPGNRCGSGLVALIRLLPLDLVDTDDDGRFYGLGTVTFIYGQPSHQHWILFFFPILMGGIHFGHIWSLQYCTVLVRHAQ